LCPYSKVLDFITIVCVTVPFVGTYDQNGPITTDAFFNLVHAGVTEPITVTWLGKRYDGTLNWSAGISPQITFEQDGASS
jgi:hypothetical protein